VKTKSANTANTGESQKLSPSSTSSFKLYEINDSIAEVADMLSLAVDQHGEIIEEALLDRITTRLNELNVAQETKASNLAIYIKSLQGEADLLAKERERLEKREHAIHVKLRWLKNYLVSCLQTDPSTPGITVSGVRSSISWRKSDSINVNAVDRLPLRFQKYSVSDITEDEILLFGETLKRLRGLTIEPRKDILKKHMKDRQLKQHKFRHVAAISERYTIQIK
jgi:hypothetical protein